MSELETRLANIRLVAFDIDGVFTDGRFYLSDDGVETKSFNTQDGYGIRRLLEAGIEVAVISGRQSAAVGTRMQELGVTHVFQGSRDKVSVMGELLRSLGLAPNQMAYVGDDVPDLPLLQLAGVSFAVQNAVAEVRKACAITTAARGGFGAVREVCDTVLGAVAR